MLARWMAETKIDTCNSKHIMGYTNEEQEHIEKLRKAGVIEWASPSVLVRKREGSVR